MHYRSTFSAPAAAAAPHRSLTGSRLVLCAALACGCAAAAWWLIAPAEPPARSPAGGPPSITGANLPAPMAAGHPLAPMPGGSLATQAAIGALQDQLAVLSTRVDRLRLETESRAGRSPAMPSSATPALQSDQAAKPTDDTSRAEAQQAERQLAQARDAAFRAEPADAQWARSTGAALMQALSAPPAGGAAAPTVGAVDCRSKTCRVEVTAGGAELGETLAGIAARTGNLVPSLVADAPDPGRPGGGTVLYFSR